MVSIVISIQQQSFVCTLLYGFKLSLPTGSSRRKGLDLKRHKVIHDHKKRNLIPTKIAALSRQLVEFLLQTHCFWEKLILQIIPKVILNFLTEWTAFMNSSHPYNDAFRYYSYLKRSFPFWQHRIFAIHSRDRTSYMLLSPLYKLNSGLQC